MMTLRDRFQGAMVLSAVGDALGWVTEFEATPDGLAKKYGQSRVTDFVDWEKRVGGPYLGYLDKIKAGSYSDDTQLTLAVARCIGPGGHVDHERFAKVELNQWLHYARGGGRTVKVAAEKIARKSVHWDSNFFEAGPSDRRIDYREAGANGAAMRVLPIALALRQEVPQMVRETFANGLVTHGHPRALLGAVLYGLAIHAVLRSAPGRLSPDALLSDLEGSMEAFAGDALFNDMVLQAWLARWDRDQPITYREKHQETLAEIRQGLEDIRRSWLEDRDPTEVLRAMGCFAHETKGSGTVTVLAALYLTCRYLDDPEAGVLAAVNALGADTDSIAAIVGGLLGALHGMAGVPERWRSVQDAGYLLTIAEYLHAGTHGRQADTAPGRMPTLQALFDGAVGPGHQLHFPPLGVGTVEGLKRKPTRTQGKSALQAKVAFETGQTCVFSHIVADVARAVLHE